MIYPFAALVLTDRENRNSTKDLLKASVEKASGLSVKTSCTLHLNQQSFCVLAKTFLFFCSGKTWPSDFFVFLKWKNTKFFCVSYSD